MPKKDRNKQPTTNQELSTGKPRHKPCCFYPSGARTHLPPIWSCRTCLPRTLLEVTLLNWNSHNIVMKSLFS